MLRRSSVRGREPLVSGLTGLDAAVRRLLRRRVLRLWALGGVLLGLAVIAAVGPLALAEVGESGPAPGAPPRVAPGPGHPSAAAAARARSRRVPPSPQAIVTFGRDLSTAPVPRSFFGLSTEYWTLPLFERDTPAFERVLSLLHVTGDGPLILRIGGDSADHSFWSPKARKMPDWAFALTTAYLA